MDSLLMTKTIICNNCKNFIPDRNTENDIIISVLDIDSKWRILTRNKYNNLKWKLTQISRKMQGVMLN